MYPTALPRPEPVPIAPETWLIPNTVPAEPGTHLMVNSMLVRGDEPIIIDTGAPIHRDHWLEQVFSLVEPEDVRWVFLSHDDGDHTGGLLDVLERCPSATLVTNFFAVERLALEKPALPLERMRWLEPGDAFDAGDRRFRLMLPPIFDGPTTRGLFDERTGALWTVDSFAALVTDAGFSRADVPQDLYDETFPLFNSLVSPWHQFLDPVRYARHVDSVAGLRPDVVASAHGPVLTGAAITDAFDRVRALAGAPRIMGPGQAVLDELVAAATTTAA